MLGVWGTYFLFFHRVCCLAQCLRLKLFKLLLSLIYNYSLFMDPSSLSNTTEELDVILSVTCTHAKKGPPIAIIWPLNFIHRYIKRTALWMSLYLWCLYECGPSSVGQKRPCRATTDRFPLLTTPDLRSQTPYRSPSLELQTDDEPLEPGNKH